MRPGLNAPTILFLVHQQSGSHQTADSLRTGYSRIFGPPCHGVHGRNNFSGKALKISKFGLRGKFPTKNFKVDNVACSAQREPLHCSITFCRCCITQEGTTGHFGRRRCSSNSINLLFNLNFEANRVLSWDSHLRVSLTKKTPKEGWHEHTFCRNLFWFYRKIRVIMRDLDCTGACSCSLLILFSAKSSWAAALDTIKTTIATLQRTVNERALAFISIGWHAPSKTCTSNHIREYGKILPSRKIK